MKTLPIYAFVFICLGLQTVHAGGESTFDSKLGELVQRYEKEKFGVLNLVNKRYVEKAKELKKQAMKAGDLDAANAANRQLKALISEGKKLKQEHANAQLIAGLAGDWKLTSSGWKFRIHPDGSVTASEPIKERGKIEVINLEEGIVRMSGFAHTLTWVVAEGSSYLFGTMHPAKRIRGGQDEAAD